MTVAISMTLTGLDVSISRRTITKRRTQIACVTDSGSNLVQALACMKNRMYSLNIQIYSLHTYPLFAASDVAARHTQCYAVIVKNPLLVRVVLSMSYSQVD